MIKVTIGMNNNSMAPGLQMKVQGGVEISLKPLLNKLQLDIIIFSQIQSRVRNV